MIIKSDLRDASLEALSSDPSAGKAGRIFYNSTDKIAKIDNGTAILPMGELATSEVTGTSQSISAGYRYIANNAAQVVFTLPSTAAVGDRFAIVGKGAGGWKIAQNASQYIIKGTSTTATGTDGSLISAHKNSCVEIVCTIADTAFQAVNSEGDALAGGGFQGTVTGYSAGRFQTGTYRDTIDKLTFSSETAGRVTATLSANRFNNGGITATLKGYELGGDVDGSSYQNAIEALTFSGESVATLAATLSNQRKQMGAGSSSVAGYSLGGFNAGGTETNVIDKLTFSSEAISTPAATLSASKRGGCGISAPLAAYLAGGYNGSARVSTIDKLLYSTETRTSISDTTSQNIMDAKASSSTSSGYMLGGDASGNTSRIEKLNFTTESMDTLAATLDTAKSTPTAVSSTTKGYTLGGYTSDSVNVIEDISFTDDTSVTISATLTGVSSNCAGFQD